MATFTYQALNATGKPQDGTVEASNSDEAIQKIKSQGFFPTSVREQKVKKQAGAAGGDKKKKKKGGSGSIEMPFGKVKSKNLTTFTRQLSVLQDAGLPLLRSLQILESQQKPGLLKNTLIGVTEEVEGGTSLSDSMAKHPRAFDRLYCKMVAAGEIGGVLDVILQRLSEFMEKAERLKAKIKGAMIYPVSVIVIATGIVTGIMVFIVPQFQEIFADFGVALPAATQFLIDSSAWISGSVPGQRVPGWIIVIAFFPILMVLWNLIRLSGPGRAATDFMLLYIPVLGDLVRKTVVARFTRTLGTLVAAGVPILEAVLITRDTSGNWVFERALTRVHDSIREGESFAVPLRESKTCDPLVVNMIDVGEETGEMDNMLLKIADNYDEEVDVAVAGLIKMIEPMLMLFLGVVIGGIVIAMFMPMVAMIESLQGGGV
ncbi:MAG: type II secretion system F family protein [Planctomycetota bacterium]